MNKYSIKDLEQMSGVKAHTLRIWEQRYQIIEPHRTKTNIRYYDGAALRKLLNICMLQEHGFKISRIAEMSNTDMVKHINFIVQEDGKFSHKVHALTLAMIAYDQNAFEDIIDISIKNYGIEDTILFVIYPLMQKIGYLWLTEAISPAQEHFVSNLIRAKLIVATEALPRTSSDIEPSFILYLPEGEYHETTLLFANYSIREQGKKVIYLGQNLPFIDLEKVYKDYPAPYIFTSITTRIQDIEGYIDKLSKKFPKSTVLVAGLQVAKLTSRWSNIKLLLAPDDLSKYF